MQIILGDIKILIFIINKARDIEHGVGDAKNCINVFPYGLVVILFLLFPPLSTWSLARCATAIVRKTFDATDVHW